MNMCNLCYIVEYNFFFFVFFFALLASYRESAGCEVHHASAGGDRLIILTTLGVAD